MEDLAGKVAVVTGAASGIGEAMARRFADEQMRLVLGDIDTEGLDRVSADLSAAGVESVAVGLDVSQAAEVEALAAAALDAFGSVQVVCNNAGVGAGGPIDGVPLDDWRWVIDVDLWSVIHGMRTFLPLLEQHGEGHIVNTASVAGLFAPPFMGPYNAAKAAVVAISETACTELSMRGSPVGVSVLCPGWVKTRIAESDRNRPGGGAGQVAASSELNDALRGFIEGGIAPAVVADLVVQAIRERRFYILTHDDSLPAVRARFEAIAGGGDPPLLTP